MIFLFVLVGLWATIAVLAIRAHNARSDASLAGTERAAASRETSGRPPARLVPVTQIRGWDAIDDLQLTRLLQNSAPKD